MSMTPAPILIACLTANPDLGALRPYGPLCTWIAISVDTFPEVYAGIIMSSELYRSYPAASDVLQLGTFPFWERNWIWRFSDSVDIWELVRFILTTLLILADSSTSWPEGQVRYVKGIFVWSACVCSCGSVTVWLLHANMFQPFRSASDSLSELPELDTQPSNSAISITFIHASLCNYLPPLIAGYHTPHHYP